MLWMISLLACGEQEPLVMNENDEEPLPTSAPSQIPVEDVLKTNAGDVTFHPGVHATLWMDVAGTTVWVDPWSKADLTGPKADLILLTDIHSDHLDAKAIEQVRKPDAMIIAPVAVVDELAKEKLEKLNIHTLNNDGTIEFVGLTIEAVPMYNLERGPESGKLYHDKGRGNGYVMSVGGRRIYIAGDTECTEEMRALKNIDVAFIPMSLPYTMTPMEASACIAAFKPKIVYPYHYGDSDLSVLEAPLKEAGVELRKRNWYPHGSPF